MLKTLRPIHRWLLAIAVAWVIAIVGAPSAIRAAYDGRLGPFDALIGGQATHPVDFYVQAWHQLSLRLSIALLVAIAIVLKAEQRGFQWRAALARIRLPVIRDRDVITFSVFFAVLGGFAEAIRWIIEYFVLHRVTARAVSWDLLWMTPVSALAGLISLGLLFIAASRAIGRRAPAMRGIAPAAFCFVVVYNLGNELPLHLHKAALAILSLGIATAFLDLATRQTEAVLRFARRGGVVGIALVVLFASLLPVVRSVQFNRSFHGTAKGRKDGPNIVFIIWDTVRAASLSLYGYERNTTPNLEKLAKNGVVFDRAVTPASWTLPAHASIFTGLYHHQHSADHNAPLDPSANTIAEFVRSRGYQTAGFIGNTYWGGAKFGLSQGFDWYDDRPLPSLRSVLTAWRGSDRVFGRFLTQDRWHQAERITAARSHRSLLKWLDNRRTDRPFFVFVNEFDAHEPYLPPPPGGFRFSTETPLYHWDVLSQNPSTPGQLADLHEAYDACIYYLDEQLESLRLELARRGLLDNTLIILTADHGETLGEQNPRLLGHANNIYFDVLHVPLVFYWPSHLREGKRVQQLVSLVDIAATIADVTEHSSSSKAQFPGTSLWPLVSGEGHTQKALSPALSQVNPADYHIGSKVWPTAGGSLHSLVTPEGWQYIANKNGQESLFDVKSDPWENVDLANTPAGQRLAAQYRRTMINLLAEKNTDGAPSKVASTSLKH